MDLLNFKQHLVIISFCMLVFGVTVLSIFFDMDNQSLKNQYSQPNKNTNIESYFKKADYYLIGKTRSNFHLFSDELIHNHGLDELILTSPNGVILTKEGEPTYYSAASGFYQMEKGKLNLKTNVLLRMKTALINSDSLVYDESSSAISASGNVYTQTQNYDKLFDVVVESDYLNFYDNRDLLKYRGHVRGKINRNRQYEVPISFGADRVSFYMLKKKAILNGNVSIKKQGVTALARRGEIYLENYNKRLKYFALHDDVIVKEKVRPIGQEPFERKAFSENLEGYTSESKIVLLGNPKVYQKNDVLKGNIIVLRENNETIEVDDANTNFKLR